MARRIAGQYTLFQIFGIITAGFIIYIMTALVVFKEQIFLQQDTVSVGEFFIIIGFISVLIFNIISIIRVFRLDRSLKNISAGTIMKMLLGVFCIIFLYVEKVMLDEIGRELLLGWEATGELIILYVFLVIQLSYSIINIKPLFNKLNRSTIENA